MGLAERADLIVDFTDVPVGSYVLGNLGPDEPFGGGEPRRRLRALPIRTSTGQVLQFRVVPSVAPDPTTPPQHLSCRPSPPCRPDRDPAVGPDREGGIGDLGRRAAESRIEGPTRPCSATSSTGCRSTPLGRPGHREPRRRRHRDLGVPQHHRRRPPHARPRDHLRGGQPPGAGLDQDEDEVAADPARRQRHASRSGRAGFKDTVIAYPGEVTRIKARFNYAGSVRLALPHRRARGQRDDAALPDRPRTARPARPTTSPARHRLAAWPS